MKRKIEPAKGLQMLDHGPTVLIGVRYEARSGFNLFAVSWIVPCSVKPPLVVISVNPKNLSHQLLKDAAEFTVNIPNADLLDELHFCGTSSGRDIDKIQKLSLTPVEAQTLRTPLVKECIGHLECKVIQNMEVGDHTFFIAEVVAVSVNDGLFDTWWHLEKDEAKTLHYLGGTRYAPIGEILEAKQIK